MSLERRMRRQAARHPKGRSEGEALPGGTALVNHANREKLPFLLAQTKNIKVKTALLGTVGPDLNLVENPSLPVNPLDVTKQEALTHLQALFRTLPEEMRQALTHWEYQKVADYIKVPMYALKGTMERAGLGAPPGALPPEPAPAIVNTAAEPVVTTESPLEKSVIRASYANNHLSIVTDLESAEIIGRIGDAIVGTEPDGKIGLFVPLEKEKGRQWTVYSPHQPNMRRAQMPRKFVTVKDQSIPTFGMTAAVDWTLNEDGLFLKFDPANLVPLREVIRDKPNRPHKRNGNKTMRQLHPNGGRRTPAEERLEDLPDTPVTLDTVGSQEQHQSEPLPEVMETDMTRRIASRVASINESKRLLGDDLRLFIDTTTGELRAQFRVSTWKEFS